MGRILVLLGTLGLAAPAAAQTLGASDTVNIGAAVEITLSGAYDERDFVTIVAPGTPEGRYDAYKYARSATVTLMAPDLPGRYEIRLLGAASPYPTRASRGLTVVDVPTSLEAPDRVDAGAEFAVAWEGPGNSMDYVAWAEAGADDGVYRAYRYTKTGNPVTLTAPDEPGQYELRYFIGGTNRLLARRPLTVGGVTAELRAPAAVPAGSDFAVSWAGPDNARDFVTLVAAGTAEGDYDRYRYTSSGNPLTLRAPDEPGSYELRYATGQSYATLARAAIEVTGVTASVEGPGEAVAGSDLEVGWEGPGNPTDFIALALKGSDEGSYETWAPVSRGDPLTLRAPLAAGEYELRYCTGQSYRTLASTPLRLTPAERRPGRLVVRGASGLADGVAVEVILDASGSMLQTMGSERRIEIAKRTLAELIRETIPAGVPFALRVFGKEEGSCRSDLEIPLRPLDPAQATGRIAEIEARNNAKTAIAASLRLALEDLGGGEGERLLVLITDGEETCGGDPPAAIAELQRAGVPLTLNIVGFAIDDGKLRAAFRQWSEMGGGGYFDGRDAAGLAGAVEQAFRPAFAVLDASGRTVGRGFVGGEGVELMPGTYDVRGRGKTRRVQIRDGATTELEL